MKTVFLTWFAVLVITNSSLAFANEDIFFGWKHHITEPYSYGLGTSYFSPDGTHYAYIDGAKWNKSWEEIYSIGKPNGYISQTVIPTELLGKHVHVSGFLKTEKPNIELAVEKFRANLLAELTEKDGETDELNPDLREQYVEFKVSQVRKSVQYHSKNIEYGISVFLHAPNKVYRQNMTQASMRSESDWWRLNVETGIPTDCKYVSVVIWSSGFVKTTVDFLAVVNQGDILEMDKNYSSHIVEIDNDLIEFLRAQEDTAKLRFENMSFESD